MLRFHLHGFRMTTHRLYAKASNQPDGFPGDESLYVFAANERNVLPKAASELVDQPTPVSIFFGFHLFEDFSCCGVVVPQARCKVSIDPAICFFVRNSQGRISGSERSLKFLDTPQSKRHGWLTVGEFLSWIIINTQGSFPTVADKCPL